jgi:hypothetical protein
MTTRQEGNRQRSRAIMAGWFFAAIAVGIVGFSGPCGAAELLPPARAGAASEVLASVTVLSEAAMAKEAATGAAPAQIIGDQTGRGKVMLWDEMRAPPDLPPGTNGTVTLTTGGGGK